MFLALVLGAALGAQVDPPAGPGPLDRFVICPGNSRCPARPAAAAAPQTYTMVNAMPGILIGHGGPRDPEAGRPGMLLFAAGDATLNAAGRALLDGIAERMGAAGDVDVLLEGHADAPGGGGAGATLAGRRAAAAADYLSGRGVPAARILAIGWDESGEAAPAAPRSVVASLRRRQEAPAR